MFCAKLLLRSVEISEKFWMPSYVTSMVELCHNLELSWTYYKVT